MSTPSSRVHCIPKCWPSAGNAVARADRHADHTWAPNITLAGALGVQIDRICSLNSRLDSPRGRTDIAQTRAAPHNRHSVRCVLTAQTPGTSCLGASPTPASVRVIDTVMPASEKHTQGCMVDCHLHRCLTAASEGISGHPIARHLSGSPGAHRRSSAVAEPNISVSAADIPLDRDRFMRTLIRELAGTLESVVGVEEATGYISVVGAAMGDAINSAYRKGLQVSNLSRPQVAQVLVDLKRRIEGQFYVIEESDDKIVFGNTACPFGDKVLGRPSMCMMTSNVFGRIAAENLGYAKVELLRTIAAGHGECRVIVYLGPLCESEAAQGREYFKSNV